MDSYRLHASQAHGGSVNTLNTPKVQYSYASGSTNSIRMTGMTYPNGRTVVNDYGTADLIDDACSRIQSMKDSGAAFNLADYQYLGLSGFVNAASAHRFCPLSPVPGGDGQCEAGNHSCPLSPVPGGEGQGEGVVLQFLIRHGQNQ